MLITACSLLYVCMACYALLEHLSCHDEALLGH